MSLQQKITDLATAVASDIKNLRTTRGDLSTLSTTAKNNLVAAINELKGLIDNVDLSSIINDSSTSLSTTYSSTKISSDIAAAVAALVNSSPAALDTLQELAAALGNDPNFATTIATSLGEKVGVTAQSFSGAQQIQARANIGAASNQDMQEQTVRIDDLYLDLGLDSTDFVDVYTTTRDAP